MKSKKKVSLNKTNYLMITRKVKWRKWVKTSMRNRASKRIILRTHRASVDRA